jgi:dihydrofolate reductase
MRKIIAAFNMSIDGYCDHTSMIADDEMLEHYSELLSSAGTVLYGRITYQLMEFWQTVVKNPTGKKPMDKYAESIDKISKIVFSKTLKNVKWESAMIAKQGIEKEVSVLQQQTGKDILVCSPSLIVALTKLNLIDEYQLCVHPVIAGSGLPLFKNINEKIILKLIKTKNFAFGAVTLYYEPTKK